MITTKPLQLFNLKIGDTVYYYAYNENHEQYIKEAKFKNWGNYGCLTLETNENGKELVVEKVVRDVFAL